MVQTNKALVGKRGALRIRPTKKPVTGDTVWFARERLGFMPDAMQEALLRCDAKQGF